jgi:hypothetical protein
MLKAPNKMPFDHFKPAVAFHKRKPKMKEAHCLFALCLTALHHGQNSLVPSCNAPNRKF